jgi:DNA-binding CsgD family transcriptional regulator
MLATGDLDEARAASRELDDTAASMNTETLIAIAARARGSVLLAEGNPSAVMEPVRRAFGFWQRLGAPYLAARLRVLLARACIAVGDSEGARLELECARDVFEQVGARPDLVALESLIEGLAEPGKTSTPANECGLTERELQVLRLVASGKTNKAIARELSLSEKTVDRHLSNIFAKTDVNSRAAATAFAYERKLI